MSTTTWTPTAGKRAWFGDRNCDVIRVYAKTATVSYWGSGCLEGKLVTHRGVSLRSLAAPRRMGEIDPVTGKRIWTEVAS